MGTGIGGDAFCLFFDAKTKEVTAILGCGAAPAALTLEARFTCQHKSSARSASCNNSAPTACMPLKIKALTDLT